MYDVPDYVRNLFNTTMVAYGGEIDPQRASSQIMAEAFKAEAMSYGAGRSRDGTQIRSGSLAKSCAA